MLKQINRQDSSKLLQLGKNSLQFLQELLISNLSIFQGHQSAIKQTIQVFKTIIAQLHFSHHLQMNSQASQTYSAAIVSNTHIRSIGALGGCFIQPQSHIKAETRDSKDYGIQFPERQNWEYDWILGQKQAQNCRPSKAVLQLKQIIDKSDKIGNQQKLFKIEQMENIMSQDKKEKVVKSMTHAANKIFINRKAMIIDTIKKIPIILRKLKQARFSFSPFLYELQFQQNNFNITNDYTKQLLQELTEAKAQLTIYTKIIQHLAHTKAIEQQDNCLLKNNILQNLNHSIKQLASKFHDKRMPQLYGQTIKLFQEQIIESINSEFVQNNPSPSKEYQVVVCKDKKKNKYSILHMSQKEVFECPFNIISVSSYTSRSPTQSIKQIFLQRQMVEQKFKKENKNIDLKQLIPLFLQRSTQTELYKHTQKRQLSIKKVSSGLIGSRKFRGTIDNQISLAIQPFKSQTQSKEYMQAIPLKYHHPISTETTIADSGTMLSHATTQSYSQPFSLTHLVSLTVRNQSNQYLIPIGSQREKIEIQNQKKASLPINKEFTIQNDEINALTKQKQRKRTTQCDTINVDYSKFKQKRHQQFEKSKSRQKSTQHFNRGTLISDNIPIITEIQQPEQTFLVNKEKLKKHSAKRLQSVSNNKFQSEIIKRRANTKTISRQQRQQSINKQIHVDQSEIMKRRASTKTIQRQQRQQSMHEKTHPSNQLFQRRVPKIRSQKLLTIDKKILKEKSLGHKKIKLQRLNREDEQKRVSSCEISKKQKKQFFKHYSDYFKDILNHQQYQKQYQESYPAEKSSNRIRCLQRKFYQLSETKALKYLSKELMIKGISKWGRSDKEAELILNDHKNRCGTHVCKHLVSSYNNIRSIEKGEEKSKRPYLYPIVISNLQFD